MILRKIMIRWSQSYDESWKYDSFYLQTMSTGRQSVYNKKDKAVSKASKTIYICILHGLERSWQTTRWQQDGCQSWHSQQHMKPTHQHWEQACQTIQNKSLCPHFRHKFQESKICLWSNIVNSTPAKQATKSTRLYDNNRPMFVAYLLAGKWEEGTFYYYNIY